MNRRTVADDGTVIAWQDTGEGAYRFTPADVANLTVPALLILGELSGPELGTTVQHIADACQGPVVTLPGQGHGAMFTAPGLLASAIRRFVGDRAI